MATFQFGLLSQVIHVVDDLAGARQLYGDVFGGLSFYEGHSPYELRDASIFSIGNLTVEPMSPSATDGADQMPVGRFLGRFGPHLHSIAVNTIDVPALAAHLAENGIRVFGPGGRDFDDQPIDGVTSIYTHPRDSHCLLELVDFGGPLMSGSPRAEPSWETTYWQTEHPLGSDGLSHLTVVVRDLDVATDFFGRVLGCEIFHEGTAASGERVSRFVLFGSETVIELSQPMTSDGRMSADLVANGEILHSVTVRVLDLERAVSHLDDCRIGLVERSEAHVVLDPEKTFGAVLSLTVAGIPEDPREG
jgi:extradiol dioxygenase family protein